MVTGTVLASSAVMTAPAPCPAPILMASRARRTAAVVGREGPQQLDERVVRRQDGQQYVGERDARDARVSFRRAREQAAEPFELLWIGPAPDVVPELGHRPPQWIVVPATGRSLIGHVPGLLRLWVPSLSRRPLDAVVHMPGPGRGVAEPLVGDRGEGRGQRLPHTGCRPEQVELRLPERLGRGPAQLEVIVQLEGQHGGGVVVDWPPVPITLVAPPARNAVARVSDSS